MSFIADQVSRLDASLDRLVASSPPPDPSTLNARVDNVEKAKAELPRILELQRLIKKISPAPYSSGSSQQPSLIPASRIIKTLQVVSSLSSSAKTETEEGGDLPTHGPEEQLVSLLLHKAAIQAYALALNAILEQTLETSRHIWYWDDVLYSRKLPILGLNLSGPVGLYIYWIQTAPRRIYSWSGSVLEDVKKRTQERDLGLSVGWKKFYGLVKEVVNERSLIELQKRALWLSPAARARNEVESKRKELKRVRDVGSNAIGLLLGEGLGELGEVIHQHHQDGGVSSLATGNDTALKRSISLLDSVISVVSGHDEEQPENVKTVDVDGFESRITSMTKHSDSTLWTSSTNSVEEISTRLQSVLSTTILQYQKTSKARLVSYGRPSRLTRYWLPGLIAILSSSTLLRIFVNRREDIMTWIRELGQTTIAFWENWVLEPTKRVLGTIRHDSDSEIAIMSKRSLEGDRESLERMVVDFAVDTNSSVVGGKLSDTQVEDIRMKVREGDLTPVLKAYEKDMQRPVMGAVRGNLIRALLIQVQKTKVDVEVAMGGIDSLLKSQELVFGFVGLTPGIIVTFATFRWLYSTFGSRQSFALGRKKGRMLGILREMDRILTSAQPSEHGVLYYKDYGLLLCEAHVLRQVAVATIGEEKELREFLGDLEELTEVEIGVGRQRDVVRRMRWGYAKWL